MKVNYIKTKGFRKFEKIFETELYDITNITGKNRAGKSNVLYAIINIMLGTNLSGDEKACLINKNCDSSYGEMRFTDNRGMEHTLIRVKNKYSNKGNIISLDGKSITQAELTSFYKDKKLFLSVVNPIYFLNKKTAEQKELVDKYLSDIKPKTIFDRLTEDEQNKLIDKYYKDTEKTYNELTFKEQENFINCKMLDICMDVAYSNLSKSEKNVLEEIPKDIPVYISELNAGIKRTESIISSLDGKIEYTQSIVNEEIPKYKIFEKEEELSLAEQELAYLNSNYKIVEKDNQKKIVEEMERDILLKETEFCELEDEMKKGKKIYLSIKNGTSCTCPTCNQKIQDESKNITISNMYSELVAKYDRRNLLETQLKDLKIKLSAERCKYHALEGNPTVERQKRIELVKETINRLEQEKQDIQIFNKEIKIKEKNINTAKIDIKKFNYEKQEKTKLISSFNDAKKIAQKLYISYIEEKMKIAKEYLKNVNIKFYSVLKTTGEIKEDFIITYKNTPLTDLSRSETIATALEFANMFNKISNANFPIFIDDYESCTDYDFIKEYSKNTQIIVSKVEKGSNLKIADANSLKLKIIKTAIKGYKTVKTYKNNINNVAEKKAA